MLFRSTRLITSAIPVERIACPTNVPYLLDAHAKNRLNPRKNHPNANSSTRENRSFFASRDCKSNEASAGLKLSELNAEITVEIAIVSANCL